MILLDAALDYAGLFPPASLGMVEAVRGYATCRRSAHRALLGRFVVPLARLDELEAAVNDLPAHDAELPWELSVISSGDPKLDRDRLGDFQARHAREARSLSVRSVERKVATPEEIDDVVGALRGRDAGSLPWSLYLEIPTDTEAAVGVVETVAVAGAFAKVRTGGTTVDSFLSTEALARAIIACSREGVPFKATAGLHHAVRGEYPVDYGPKSPRATMHGFLNLFVAAALLDAGRIDRDELSAVLEERTTAAFQVGPDAVRWRDRELGAEAVRRARARLLHSFGTCSFEEPVEELRRMGALR